MPPSISRLTSLQELLAVPRDQLGALDIAHVSLLCAEGLPDTKGLNVEEYLATLDDWAKVVAALTVQHFETFRRRRSEFENSEPLWRMLGVARVLRDQCGIHYIADERDLKSPAKWDDSTRHMLHGLLGPKRHGTCASLPILFVAMGRRLGYPMRLVRSPGHLFSRWDALDHPNPAWREKRNLEFNGEIDCHLDEHYYHSPVKWDEELYEAERRRGDRPLFLRSITPAEELVSVLHQRGHVFEAHGMFEQAMATYAVAAALDPNDPHTEQFSKRCHKLQITVLLRPWNLSADNFCRITEKRLRGHLTPYPWEDASCRNQPYNPFMFLHEMAPLRHAQLAVAARVGVVVDPRTRSNMFSVPSFNYPDVSHTICGPRPNSMPLPPVPGTYSPALEPAPGPLLSAEACAWPHPMLRFVRALRGSGLPPRSVMIQPPQQH